MSDDEGKDIDGPATTFDSLRSRLFGIGYRMLGSRAEAEDLVQEAYVRWHGTDQSSVRNPEAWLVTTMTRLAIDRLRALKREREAYHGPWLPEPLLVEESPPPDRAVELASDLSLAFLVLLERLAPEERAAFLLHDVFECGYPEVARVLDKTESACRQMVHRARERVRSGRKRFDVPEADKVALLRKFTAAVESRDEQALIALFAPDATWTADGGGRTPAAPRPIVGSDRIVKLLLGLQRHFVRHRATIHPVTINGETGVTIRMDGRISSLLAFETDGERIVNVYAVVNPDKLAAGSVPM